MKVRYSFSSRRTGKIKNIRKQRQKYPTILEKLINNSDIVLEILDARFINETRNYEIEEYLKKQKKHLVYVINKSDLKEAEKLSIFPHIFISCKNRTGIKELRNIIKKTAKEIKEPVDKNSNKIMVGIIGYPNTGKSSLINLLIGRKSAKTGADAGFTKGIQKLKLSGNIILLDSPGVIPKKEYSSTESEKIAKHTKLGGRSYSQIKEPEIVVTILMKDFPGILQKHYEINADSEEDLIEKLGRQKNFLKKGNQVDDDKTSRFILKEWQEGKIKT